MGRKHPSPERDIGSSSNLASSRRDFLKRATTAAVGLMVAAARRIEAASLLPTVALSSHRMTRLIVGGNPIYGNSHFNRQ